MSQKPGIFTMPAEQYHADPCDAPSLSCSVAKILLTQSPLHAWMAHPKLNPDYRPDEDSRFDLGSAAHDALLENGTGKIVFIDAADWRTKAAKEQRDEARANGKLPVLAKYEKPLASMVDEAREAIERSELKGIFQQGKPEQVVIWKEGIIWCRARLDWLTLDKTVILDYKTTESAEPEAFIRRLAGMSYDVQHSFYRRGVAKTTNTLRPAFVFLAQEIEDPYACSLVSLSSAYEQVANEKVRWAIEKWRKCLETDEWPGYPTKICYAEPPQWALAEHEAMLIERGDVFGERA